MPEKKNWLSRLNHPLTYWILGWTIFGWVLSVIFKKVGLDTATASAWQVANFLILLTVLYYLAKGPAKDYLVKRRETIANDILEAQKRLEELEKRYEEIKYRFSWIEDEIENIDSQFRRETEAERARMMAEAKKQIERIKNEAEFTAKQEIKSAEARLKEEAINQALKIAEEILRKKVTAEDQVRLFEEYLREVEGAGK